jgi:hypothetical protein
VAFVTNPVDLERLIYREQTASRNAELLRLFLCRRSTIGAIVSFSLFALAVLPLHANQPVVAVVSNKLAEADRKATNDKDDAGATAAQSISPHGVIAAEQLDISDNERSVSPKVHVAMQTITIDEFNAGKLDTTKWTIATYKSPDSKPGINQGFYVSSGIDFTQGMLRISVQQRKSESGVDSSGGAIISKERFGFGIYEFVMRMSNTSPTPEGNGAALTGAISSGFLYYNKSESEIDLEFLGNQNAIWVTGWQNSKPTNDPTSLEKTSNKVIDHNLATRFRCYSMVWRPDVVDVYIDGIRVSHQTEHVPQSPAHVILQHRGTNSDKWGGIATAGVERYFFVRSVNYTPLIAD